MEKKNVKNEVTLAGKVASIDRDHVRRGTLANGATYLSFRGQMMCCSNEIPFEVFVSSKKSDGSESKNYGKIVDWLNNVTTIEDNKENPTKATLIGNLSMNYWPDSSGNFREDVKATRANIKFINDYPGEDSCFINIDGYIEGIFDEFDGENPTGRKNMTIYSKEYGNKALRIENVKIPKELVEGVETAGWEKGATANMNLSYLTQEKEKTADTDGVAFGVAPTIVSGPIKYSELIVVSGSNAFDEESPRAFSRDEYQELKEMIKAQKNDVTSRKAGIQATPTSFGAKSATEAKKVVEEDDLPWDGKNDKENW